MQIPPLVKNIFKKGLFVSVLVLGVVTLKAQQDTAAYNRKQKDLANAVEITGTITDAATRRNQ